MKKKFDIAFVDTETTGLIPHKHEIIEIAILTNEKQYHVRVKPEYIEFADKKALEINGYLPEEWLDAIPASVAAVETSQLLHGKTICGHNPSFDMSFLRELWELHNCKPYVDRRYIDTVCLAREHLPECPSYKLDVIREYLGWSRLGAHSALVDTKDTKRLFFALWRCGFLKRMYYRLRYRALVWLGFVR